MGLDRERYDPVVVLAEAGPLSKMLETHGIRVLIVPGLTAYPYNQSLSKVTSLLALLRIASSMWNLYRQLRKFNCDILHINSFMLFPYAVVGRLLGAKTVVHYREHWPRHEHRIQFWVARRIIREFAQRVIAINHHAADQIALKEKTVVVYDWIVWRQSSERDESDLLERLRSPGTFKLLFVGGLQDSKGVIEVVRAVSACTELPMLRLIIVGCEPSAASSGGKRLLKRLLGTLGWRPQSSIIQELVQADQRIITVPPILDMRSLYSKVDALVAFPKIPHAILPIAEALSMGLPVLAADLPEAREYGKGSNGIRFVRHRDVSDLAAGIREVCDQKNHYRERAQAGAETVRQVFDKSRNRKKVEAIYEGLF